MKSNSFILPAAIAAILLSLPFGTIAKEPEHADAQPKVSPAEALARLKAGNQRFVASKLEHPRQTAKRRTELATSQHPFAVVLGCADSRTAPELVFDQGLGDVFVVRVAGNVLNDETLGSIEYAVDHLGAQLIVVLGHERCGAIEAARETIAAKEEAPGHIQSLVKAIAPAVEATLGAGCGGHRQGQRTARRQGTAGLRTHSQGAGRKGHGFRGGRTLRSRYRRRRVSQGCAGQITVESSLTVRLCETWPVL